MKILKNSKKISSAIILSVFLLTTLKPISLIKVYSDDNIVTYPLKEISKLECRFKDWWEISKDCKQDLPILKTKDYEKYAKLDWGYNKFTRIYTVLWWSSYKYGWDVWNWWHIGTDIATSKWTPVYSISKWKVLYAKTMSSLWKTISIEHIINGKKVVSSYSHLSKINVVKWENVNVWQKIAEVGSTWNSTWNHLHFQIDLDTQFHPFYYKYKKCPYSYYKIVEEWVCFDELNKNTIDPLLFIETNGKVLDNIKVNKISKKSFTQTEVKKTKSNQNLDIFSKTVYVWYPSEDVKKVQEIFKKMWIYRWTINWDYNSIEDTIIAYQISKWIIKNKGENWAWRFGPKTRTQTKKDYLSYLANGTIKDVEIKTNIKTKKISRDNLLTREEIEAREVREFLRIHNIYLVLRNIWWNIKLWETEYIDLKITDKKWRIFKWTMPWWMTFMIDTNKVQVFPKKLYYFTDWKRTIQLKWLKLWDTILYVKIWNVTVKEIPIKVYNKSILISPEWWIIVWNNKIVLWDSKTSIVVLKDKNWKKLINLEYWDKLKLQTSDDIKICIKSWDIKNIKNIYNKKCKNKDFRDYIDFDYKNTVWWLVVFDYKAYWRNATIDIINKSKNKTLKSKKIAVVDPKWLKSDYGYKTEVIQILEEWVVDWLNRWYFLEDRTLKEYDALFWIRSSLIKMNENTEFLARKRDIENNLKKIFNKMQTASKYKSISREDLFTLTYDYLLINKNTFNSSKNYRDLDIGLNKKVALVFDDDITWKDKFWENYFRPREKITRWEWAYLLMKVIEKNKQVLLTVR
jgi:hypothetical protein